MKTLNLFLGLLFLFAMLSMDANAEDDFYYSCEQDADCLWSDVTTLNIECGGCMYIVEYQTRVCPDGLYGDMGHYKINRFELINPNCQSHCNNVGNYDLLEKAGRIIIETMAEETDDPAWNPSNGDCILALQGFQASCWEMSQRSPSGGWWIEPCGIEGCCRFVWYFCKDENGIYEGPEIQGIHSLAPCEPFNECHTVCGYE